MVTLPPDNSSVTSNADPTARLLHKLAASLADGSFVKLVLGKAQLAEDEQLQRVTARAVQGLGGAVVSAVRFRPLHKNWATTQPKCGVANL